MANRLAEEFTLNLDTLRICRAQLGLSLEDAKKKVKTIEAIEKGETRPTYNQFYQLAELYEVPAWVFLKENLPEEYRYESRPTFRKFKAHKTLKMDKKLRKLVAKVEQLRRLLSELARDIDARLTPFNELALDLKNLSPEAAATKAREWLGMPPDKFLPFEALRELLEKKSVFVFLTSKQAHWSKMEKDSFRGCCIPHETLPVIIINDSDSKKAQSFTLMHELGHLLQNRVAVNSWEDRGNSAEEKWCDAFAGRVLLPEEKLRGVTVSHLKELERAAKPFQLSPYVLLVRLRQEEKITQEQYDSLEAELKEEYKKQEEKLRRNKGGPARRRLAEVRAQFGGLFINIVLTAFHYKELSLVKTSKILGLKRVDQVLELAK